jgi:hypothetical protein
MMLSPSFSADEGSLLTIDSAASASAVAFSRRCSSVCSSFLAPIIASKAFVKLFISRRYDPQNEARRGQIDRPRDDLSFSNESSTTSTAL